MIDLPNRQLILAEVYAERDHQDAKFGEQNHPDGTGDSGRKTEAKWARQNCQKATADGSLTWLDVLEEKVTEAYAERDPAKLRAELVQVAAVAVAWIEAIDRRTDHDERRKAADG